jgi:hypothetical protein
MRLWLIIAALGLSLAGCDIGDDDQAGSTTGPGISTHCAAATPLGDTTVVVMCPACAP